MKITHEAKYLLPLVLLLICISFSVLLVGCENGKKSDNTSSKIEQLESKIEQLENQINNSQIVEPSSVKEPKEEIGSKSENQLIPQKSNTKSEMTYQTTTDVIESTIDGDFEGFDSDKVYKLTNGQIWQQAKYKYKYSYKCRPSVTLVKSGIYYKMLVDGLDESVEFKLIGGTLGKTTKSMSGDSTPNLIESYITNGFSGFSNGNIYKLSNGQIWEQTEYYTYTYTYTRPSIMIYKTGGVYKLKFDNIDRAVTVKRIN